MFRKKKIDNFRDKYIERKSLGINILMDELCILINDKMMRKKMGEEGRHFVEANYSLEECGLLMESVYNKCM